MQIHSLSTATEALFGRKGGPLHTKQLPIVQLWSTLCSLEFLGSHFTRNLLAVPRGSQRRASLLCNTFHIHLNAKAAQ